MWEVPPRPFSSRNSASAAVPLPRSRQPVGREPQLDPEQLAGHTADLLHQLLVGPVDRDLDDGIAALLQVAVAQVDPAHQHRSSVVVVG